MGGSAVRLLHTADVHLGARDLAFGEAAHRMREARRGFLRDLPELAAATRLWRDFFESPEDVYREGYKLIRTLA